jgi:hypothetical protein
MRTKFFQITFNDKTSTYKVHLDSRTSETFKTYDEAVAFVWACGATPGPRSLNRRNLQ